MVTELERQTTHGVIWNLIEKIGLQATRFIIVVILARLISPEEFGLIGMIMVIFAIAQVMVEAGLGSAYIQKKDANNLDANTVFYTNLSISILIYTFVWFGAPAVAGFYNIPELLNLTRVMGSIFVINSFGVIHQAKLRRAVNFKAKALVNVIANVSSGFLAIVAAIYGMGVWSIVLQFISLNMINVVGLWLVVRWKPSLLFSYQSLREMFSFGIWMLATNILATLTNSLYILTIGKLFPVAQVGYYTKAKQFQQMGSEQISQAISGVAFPVLSKIRDNEEKIRRGLNRFLTLSLVIVAPIMVSLLVGADPIVRILLTEKWLPIVPYLRILSFVGILYPIHLVNLQLLFSLGRSDLNFRLTIVIIVMKVINVLITAPYGVLYILIGEMVVSLLTLGVSTFYTKRLVRYGLLRQLSDLKSIMLSILISTLGALGIVNLIDNLLVSVLMLSTFVFLIFILVQTVMNRQLITDLKEIFFKP